MFGKKKETTVPQPEVKGIDLAALAPLELPEKSVTLIFRGEKREVFIRPLKGAARLRCHAQDYDEDTGRATENRVRGCLENGAGLTPAEADAFLEADWKAAFHLANEILVYTYEFEGVKLKEAKEAEKNSGAADAESTPTL